MAVELTMARMRVAILRHTLTGAQGEMAASGVFLGAVLAAGTLFVAVTADAPLLAAVYALWMAGWILGPVAMGGGDETLKPEHFAMLGLRPLRTASGLLTAAFAGLAPMVSLVALLGLVVFGIREGVVGALLSLPAALLTLVLFVLVSKVATGLLGLALRSRLGAIAAGVLNGTLLAGLCQIWVFLALFEESGVPGIVWYVPSGWGVRAVQGEPLALVALAGLNLLLLCLWALLLSRRTGAARTFGRPRRPIAARTASGAVLAKELRTWTRDLARAHQLAFALSFGVCFGASPVLLGWDGMLPYAGPIFVVMAAAMTSNLYGTDGTVLWLTLMTPGNDEVRARQWAWLLVMGPVAAVVTLGGTAIAGGPWPVALALLFSLLGGAAGLVPLISVYGLVPGTDPHKRAGNPLRTSEDDGGLTGLAYLMLGLVSATCVPAVLVALRHGWPGVVLGLATGVLCFVLFGRLATARLRSHGPDLLHMMRTGRRPARPTAAAVPLSAPRQLLVWMAFAFGSIALFPQGIVATVFVALGMSEHTWFLATYMPSPFGYPTSIAMTLLGASLYAFAIHQSRKAAPSRA
ncbi:hypothetical protein LO762_27860 [Actinocorallia sp. API 0066]|uniref:hypothetical protein n=1 Tax=Actinocorallia sp. API 0066 TaxID=2896846 RepID=UPI001E3335CB|nr:hypothetical protein [Actinocorallia sp. API 0066]MCD0452967.1 hypothetical protein [Actinocorallia sp. API 0066]